MVGNQLGSRTSKLKTLANYDRIFTMSFLFGGKKIRRGESVAVFDVGSGSVGYAILKVGGTSHRQGGAGGLSMESAGRVEMVFAGKPEPERFSAGMLKALGEAAEALRKSSPKIPSRIFCILSSPWHVSQTRVISYKKDKPFIFHDFMLEEIIRKEEENFMKSAAPSSGERGRIIEKKAVKVRLNGYETHTPYGKKAVSAEISCYFSTVPEIIFSKMTEVLEKKMGSAPIEFHSFSMAIFSVMRDIYSRSDAFLVVNVGGQISEVLFVKENVLLESASFPIGRNNFLRGLSSAGHAPSAASLARLHSEKAITPEETESFARNAGLVKESWLGYFRKSLIAMASEFYLPETVFLLADRSISAPVAEAISGEKFSQMTFTESPFNIFYIAPESFEKYCSVNACQPDSALIIEAIFAQKLAEI